MLTRYGCSGPCAREGVLVGMIVKAAGFFSFAPPSIIEVPGVPEVYCDVATVHDFDETVRIFLCRNVMKDGLEAELTALLTMPKGGFLKSLGWAATQFLRQGRPSH